MEVLQPLAWFSSMRTAVAAPPARRLRSIPYFRWLHLPRSTSKLPSNLQCSLLPTSSQPRFTSVEIMASSLFGGGERPPSPPHSVDKPASVHDASPSPAPASPGPTRAAPGPERPCTLHSSCRPTQVDIDRRGDLILVVGDDSCSFQDVESGDSARLKQEGPPATLEQPGQPERSGQPEGQAQKPIAFRVCSRAMARAAPSFETLLYGRFAEARKPHSGWTVRLLDDDPEVMKLLLPVMHGQLEGFDALSYRIKGAGGLRTLYKITIPTDKYDLTHILRPWAAQLVRSLEATMTTLHGLDLEKAACVSWELGSRTVFEFIVVKLVWNKPKCDFLVPLPSGVETLIRNLRLKAITALLRPIKDTIESSIARKRIPDHGFRCLRELAETGACNAAILGSLIQSLCAMGFWPLPKPADWEGTAAQLQDILVAKLSIRTSESRYHERCRLLANDGSHVGSRCHNLELPFTSLQDEHLKLRAEKLGLKGRNED